MRRAPGVVHQHTGDLTALIDLRRGRYFTLNEVGGLVWELLASDETGSHEVITAAGDAAAPDTRSDTTSPAAGGAIRDGSAAEDPPLPIVESIAAQIAAEYDVSVDRARSDVTLLLRELAAAGLVTSSFEP